jgi:hypothetical protein
MRLQRVSHAHSLGKKALLMMIRVMSGYEPPDVLKTLLYRHDFFGKRHNHLTQLAMRGPSEWTVGERELFAAFISRLNQCLF